MTNKEKFINIFGTAAYNNLVAKADKDLLLWFLDDYKDGRNYPLPVTSEKRTINVVESAVAVTSEDRYNKGYGKRPGGSGRKPGVNYMDISWYKGIIEDFYLSEEKSKAIKLDDDKSNLRKPKCLDTIQHRFDLAISELKLTDVIETHKYYQNTANACVMLENVTVDRDKVSTYKYL